MKLFVKCLKYNKSNHSNDVLDVRKIVRKIIYIMTYKIKILSVEHSCGISILSLEYLFILGAVNLYLLKVIRIKNFHSYIDLKYFTVLIFEKKFFLLVHITLYFFMVLEIGRYLQSFLTTIMSDCRIIKSPSLQLRYVQVSI